jgi:hypothetical protein
MEKLVVGQLLKKFPAFYFPFQWPCKHLRWKRYSTLFSSAAKLAGKYCLVPFLKRNPAVSPRKPESTRINRISAFNGDAMVRFLLNLEMIMGKCNVLVPDIHNVDETGLYAFQKPGRVLSP